MLSMLRFFAMDASSEIVFFFNSTMSIRVRPSWGVASCRGGTNVPLGGVEQLGISGTVRWFRDRTSAEKHAVER